MSKSITFIFYVFLGFIVFMNDSFSLPWSTDLWEHPSIKPYEEARDYPEGSVFKSEESPELDRKEYEAIVTGPKRESYLFQKVKSYTK
tara:strand:+ start:65 stop:328 length:264 start_codon:yes stop_codon:yes gene_type:complete